MKLLNRITSQQGFIDLHNHTDYSYGHEMGKMRLSPLDYLEEVRQYTEKFQKPVSFSITDHNNINANRKIMEAIAKDPEKYALVNYIPGCEYTVSCDSIGVCYDKEGNEKPIVKDNRLHMLAYGMDLEDPDVKYLNTLMSTAKRYVREYVTEFKPVKFGNIIFCTKAWLKERNMDLEIGEFKDDCQLQETFDKTVDVVDAFLRKRFNFSEEDMKSWKAFVNDDENIIKYTKVDVQEVMSIVEKAGGYCVLAHPVYAGPSEDFQHIDDPDNKDPRNAQMRNMAFDDISYKRLEPAAKERNLRKMENYYDFLYRTLSVRARNPVTGEKLNGIIGHELMHAANQKNQYKFDVMMKAGDKYGLYCTGGSDSHGFMNKYVIPSRVVGSQVQKYDTNYDSMTTAYALVKCNFVEDFLKAQKTGERLQREAGRDARHELTVLKTSETGEKYYDMNQFREVVFKSYERKKKDDKAKGKTDDGSKKDDPTEIPPHNYASGKESKAEKEAREAERESRKRQAQIEELKRMKLQLEALKEIRDRQQIVQEEPQKTLKLTRKRRMNNVRVDEDAMTFTK